MLFTNALATFLQLYLILTFFSLNLHCQLGPSRSCFLTTGHFSGLCHTANCDGPVFERNIINCGE